MPAPNRPYKPAEGPRPSTVGNGNDYAAQVAGTISSARGSFDTATGLDFHPVQFYSLQLNTNFFTTSLCVPRTRLLAKAGNSSCSATPCMPHLCNTG